MITFVLYFAGCGLVFVVGMVCGALLNRRSHRKTQEMLQRVMKRLESADIITIGRALQEMDRKE